MQQKSNTQAYIYAGISVFLWSSAFPAIKYALGFYSPGALMLFRFLIASAELLIISMLMKSRLPAKEDIPYVAAGGGIGIFIYMWLFNTGTGMVKVGVNSFIIATAPIFSMLFSILFLKEKARPAQVAGVLISALGLAIIAIGQVREVALNMGLLVLLMASVCTSLYNIIQRKISFKYTPLECCVYSVVTGTVLMLVFLPTLVIEFGRAPLFANVVVAYTGIFPAALSYLSWNYALAKAEKVTSATNFLYLTPFFATTLAFLFLGEVLSALSLVGGVIIIAGMVFSNRKPKQTTSKREAQA